MTRFVIREARAEELSTVLHHRRSMFEEMNFASPPQIEAMHASSILFFGQALAAGKYRGWFVEADGRVVAGGGVIIQGFQPGPLDPQPERPWVVNVYTEPEFRRQGLARLVMETIVAWCREAGYPSVALHASHEGRPLYETLGFKTTGEMRLRLD